MLERLATSRREPLLFEWSVGVEKGRTQKLPGLLDYLKTCENLLLLRSLLIVSPAVL
jgi:hypothetical protein